MHRSRVWLCLIAVALVASPAAAELFYVSLNNGSVLESRYQPQQASWDGNLVLLMTEVGNWVGVRRDEIESVTSETQNRGYGIAINTTTILLGVSPNDAVDPNAEPAAAGGVQASPAAQVLQQALQQRAKEESYSVQQFVEPNQTQGIPPRFVSPSAVPPSQ
jgi:hypothetical protein